VKEILAYKLQSAFHEYKDNAALRIGDDVLSYGELHQMANAIANDITAGFPDDKSPVAILGAKSFMTYAGICGALLASRAYMPLNLKFPDSRNEKMMQLSGAKIIVADVEAKQALERLGENYKIISEVDGANSTNIPLAVVPEDTAYLLFTSGTTGTPKGVPVSNRNVCAYLDHVSKQWQIKENDRLSQTFDLTFDLSVHDMFLCWISGACLCIPEDDSPFKLASYIREQEISVWFSVPSAAVLMDRMRLLKEDKFKGIRLSFFCGEPFPAAIAEKWQAAVGGSELVNLYGPSEATIAISSYSWDNINTKEKNGIACLGKIFEGQESLLLDTTAMRPAESKGELCLGGSQVIDAYLGDAELTKKYFIQLDEHPEKTWYRTGDLACIDEEGDLFFLGRADSEVKISGYRVNLQEIDAIIRKATGSNSVASILHEKQTAVIVSFVGGIQDPDDRSILQACRKELPWYMIPERIIFVDKMPLNVNGKIDRNALKQMING